MRVVKNHIPLSRSVTMGPIEGRSPGLELPISRFCSLHVLSSYTHTQIYGDGSRGSTRPRNIRKKEGGGRGGGGREYITM